MNDQSSRPDIMKGIPRGLRDKFLKDQKMPMASWLSVDAILAHEPFRYDPKNPQGKILIGAVGEQLIGVRDERHTFSCAGSRGGKSTTLTANLFFYDGSVLVIDPKNEHAKATAKVRARMGQKVIVLAPYSSDDGLGEFFGCYNPMQLLDIASEGIIEDALQIIDAIVVKSGNEKDPHWNESASDFLLGILLYIAFGSNIADDDRNLITVRKLVKQARKTVRIDAENTVYWFPGEVRRGIAHLKDGKYADIAEIIQGAVEGLYEKSHDEMAGVLSTARRHTAFLDYRAMRKTLTGHDFDLRDLKRKKVSVYLCLPATKLKALNRWLRIIINQLISEMESEQAIPDVPVLAMLDEMPVLKHMEALENAAGMLASFHLKLWFVCQDINQLQAIYKDRWQSFLGNSGVSQWFANLDHKTCEYISKVLGKTPVLGLRQGETSSDQRDKGLSGSSEAKELYPLLTHDEVPRVFSKDDPLRRQYVQVGGLMPAIISRVEWYNSKSGYAEVFDDFR